MVVAARDRDLPRDFRGHELEAAAGRVKAFGSIEHVFESDRVVGGLSSLLKPWTIKPMRIIVTGGAGFVGSSVCRLLEASGHDILSIDKLTYAGNLGSLRSIARSPRFLFAHADIRDGPRMVALFQEFRPDGVMHLAAESHVDRSISSSRNFIETNVLGTHTLLEVARDYWMALRQPEKDAFRFLSVSTDEVYGSLGVEGKFTEQSPCDPSSPYAASKAAADLLAGAWRRTYGLPVMVSRCSNNFGPFQFPEKLIPLAVLNARVGLPISVYGRGLNVRDWLHVEDHAKALLVILARGQPGETYNVGGRNERSNITVVRQICTILDELAPESAHHDRLIEFVADRPGHDYRYAIDASKLETELGWRAELHFETGLRQTVRWFLDNAWWWRPLRDRIYGGERLGVVGRASVG